MPSWDNFGTLNQKLSSKLTLWGYILASINKRGAGQRQAKVRKKGYQAVSKTANKGKSRTVGTFN